ncbi:MAG: hypothetical protein LBM27_06285 [Lactobacillaceae bacterium]|jgi:glutamate--cysteine ligase|nr:hypothetical protein [Lactobacillaceae bacterium]
MVDGNTMFDFFKENGFDPFSFNIALEIEEHRVVNGQLSQYPFPENLGNRQNPNTSFTTDFTESMIEIITRAHSNNFNLEKELNQLQLELKYQLQPGESIWTNSMPPTLNLEDEKWVLTHFDRPWKQKYRDYLIEKYGIYHHMMSGIHINFSFNDDLLVHFNGDINALYFQVAQNLIHLRYLFVYLFGNSNVDFNPGKDSRIPIFKNTMKSIRASRYGFRNDTDISYSGTYQDFKGRLQSEISNGYLYDAAEFYGPVRFKETNDRIHYIEVRISDLVPQKDNLVDFSALELVEYIAFATLYGLLDFGQRDIDADIELSYQVAEKKANLNSEMLSKLVFPDEFKERFFNIYQVITNLKNQLVL